MTVGVISKFLGTITELLIPWMLSYILDNIVPLKDTRRVLIWGVYMTICAILALVMNIYANRVASSVARDTTRALRHDLFKKISYLSCRKIDYFTIPSLESRLTTDTYNVNQVIGMMQRMGIRAPILLIGGICITMTMEPVLTLVMMSVLPFIALVVWLVSRKGIPMYGDLQKAIDAMVRTVREDISGIRVIKALSKIEQEKEHFSKVNREVVRRDTRASLTMAVTNPMMNLLLNAGLTLVIFVGAFRVNGGQTQPGVIIAFLSYFTIILNAMLSITRIFVMYSKASASASRIHEVLNTSEDMNLTHEPAKEEEEHIVFEHVSFSYKNKKVKNVNDISFKLKKGETLGIIGATGAGKTTIINLLMRLYEKDSGSGYIGHCPYQPPDTLASLRAFRRLLRAGIHDKGLIFHPHLHELPPVFYAFTEPCIDAGRLVLACLASEISVKLLCSHLHISGHLYIKRPNFDLLPENFQKMMNPLQFFYI